MLNIDLLFESKDQSLVLGSEFEGPRDMLILKAKIFIVYNCVNGPQFILQFDRQYEKNTLLYVKTDTEKIYNIADDTCFDDTKIRYTWKSSEHCQRLTNKSIVWAMNSINIAKNFIIKRYGNVFKKDFLDWIADKLHFFNLNYKIFNVRHIDHTKFKICDTTAEKTLFSRMDLFFNNHIEIVRNNKHRHVYFTHRTTLHIERDGKRSYYCYKGRLNKLGSICSTSGSASWDNMPPIRNLNNVFHTNNIIEGADMFEILTVVQKRANVDSITLIDSINAISYKMNGEGIYEAVPICNKTEIKNLQWKVYADNNEPSKKIKRIEYFGRTIFIKLTNKVRCVFSCPQLTASQNQYDFVFKVLPDMSRIKIIRGPTMPKSYVDISNADSPPPIIDLPEPFIAPEPFIVQPIIDLPPLFNYCGDDFEDQLNDSVITISEDDILALIDPDYAWLTKKRKHEESDNEPQKYIKYD